MFDVNRSKQNTGAFVDLLAFFSALVIAFAALTYSASKQIDFENLAKGEQNTSCGETFQAKTFTASSVKNLKAAIDGRQVIEHDISCNSTFYRILWLGNSQMHHINQFKDGDHLSPYWLRIAYKDPTCFEPLGFSLPNVNIQEFLIISSYVGNFSISSGSFPEWLGIESPPIPWVRMVAEFLSSCP